MVFKLNRISHLRFFISPKRLSTIGSWLIATVEKSCRFNYKVTLSDKDENNNNLYTVSIYDTVSLVESLRHPDVEMNKVLSKEKSPSPKHLNNPENYHKIGCRDNDMQLKKVQINFFNYILEVIL